MKIANSAHTLSEAAAAFLKRQQGLYINGSWQEGGTSDKIAIVNPATEEELGLVINASRGEVDAAVQAAATAFKAHSWRRMAPMKRERLLLDFADKLEQEAETLAEILTLENGKLFSHAKGEIKGAANTFRYFAGWATKIEGQTLDLSLRQAPGKQNFAFTRKEPVGVVAAIVPWNFPISIAAWKLAPLLAAGCTVVLKPSEVTPLSTLYMAEFFDQVGFPPGVVNVVTGDGKTGADLTTHPLIDKITFTGSTEVGKIIGKSAMDDLKGVSLELGGKSPGIVFDDADLESAASGLAKGIFRNGGQVCVAGSRLYIQKKSYDKLLSTIADEAAKMKISHGFDMESDLGPLVSSAHLERVSDHIQNGKEQKAELVYGGSKPKVAGGKGFYMEPTIFSCTSNDQNLMSQEIFGPVLSAFPFDTKDEAIQLANDSKFGLSSTVWTKDIDKALHCVNELDAGWVFVNAVARSDANFPLGGNKHSGIGRELGKEGVHTYLKTKSVNIVY